MSPKLIFLAAVAVIALPLLSAGAALPERIAALRGVEFIRTTQQPDGGFGGFGPGQTLDAILAIRAAGFDPATFTKDGATPVTFMNDQAGALAESPALAGKAALAARALGLDPRDLNGVDLLAAIAAGYDGSTGQYAEDAFSHSLAMIGFACGGGGAVPASAVLALRDMQLDDGGWGFGGFADADTTGLAIQALAAAGLPAGDPAIAAAVAYLRATQSDDGGWGFDPAASNANSTAVAVQGLTAAGEDVESPAYARDGVTPVAFLLSVQQADGSFPGFDPAFATNQTVPALAGKTFCTAANTPVRSTPAVGESPTPAPPATGTGAAAGTASSGSVSAAALALFLLTAAGGAAAIAARPRARR